MSEKNSLFLELLRVALGNQESLSKTPTEDEWAWLFEMAEKQAVDGITFDALGILVQHGQKAPEDIMLTWYGYSEQIKEQNKIVNQRCKDITELFTKAGFKTCILKGQGNAMMYPNPMARVSGDIDVWVKGNRDDIISFCQSKGDVGKRTYLHIDFSIYDDVPVEVHFIPSYPIVLLSNKKLQRYFGSFQTEGKNVVDVDDVGFSMSIPEKKVNLVFQMSHMMRHFFFGGIGFRQVIDYYYLLRYADGKYDKEEVARLYKSLGMMRFAKAVMWIMKEILGMDEKYLIVSPEAKRGRLLLDEIMRGGNFGSYDDRWTKCLQKHSFGLFVIIRNIKYFVLFPNEVLWTPITSVYKHLK